MERLKEFFYSLPRIVVVSLYKLIVRIRVVNYKRIPLNSQVIFAINHVTGADPILLMAGLKKKMVFFAISDDFKTKFTDFFFRKVGNAIPVFQKNFEKNFASFKQLIAASKRKDCCFAVFPEGKLNKTDKYDDFKKGAAYFAYKTKIPVIPVYIQGIKGYRKGTRIEQNKVSEGIFALVLNIFRKINIFIGNPINPMAENVINDLSNISDSQSYRVFVDDIHNQIESNYSILQDEACELLKDPQKLALAEKN